MSKRQYKSLLCYLMLLKTISASMLRVLDLIYSFIHIRLMIKRLTKRNLTKYR